MKDKIKIYKELDFVYIVNGQKFISKKIAEEYLRHYNEELKSEQKK